MDDFPNRAWSIDESTVRPTRASAAARTWTRPTTTERSRAPSAARSASRPRQKRGRPVHWDWAPSNVFSPSRRVILGHGPEEERASLAGASRRSRSADQGGVMPNKKANVKNEKQ